MEIKRCLYCGKFFKDDLSFWGGEEFLSGVEEFELAKTIQDIPIGVCSNPRHEEDANKCYKPYINDKVFNKRL